MCVTCEVVLVSPDRSRVLQGSWFVRNNFLQVMFVVGGCTWSEIQAVHELSQHHGVEVLLGSTSMIDSGEDFLRDMGRLAPFGVATDSVAIEMGGTGSGSGSRQGSRQGSGTGSNRRSR